MLVYLRDGSAQTIVRAATLRYKLQIKLSISPSRSILIPAFQFQCRRLAGFVCLLVGCLTSQQQASVSQGRICSGNFTCCHTEIEVADQTFYLTQSKYTDTGPTSPGADPISPGAWHYSVSAGTGRPGVSILWLGEVESSICSFYLSVAARKIVWADPSLRYTSLLVGCQATNKQTVQVRVILKMQNRCASFETNTIGGTLCGRLSNQGN